MTVLARNILDDGIDQLWIRVWVERALNDSEHAQMTCREHAAILAALRTRDPAAAADAMSSHMDSAGERLARSL